MDAVIHGPGFDCDGVTKPVAIFTSEARLHTPGPILDGAVRSHVPRH